MILNSHSCGCKFYLLWMSKNDFIWIIIFIHIYRFHIPVWCGSSFSTLAGAPWLHHTPTVVSHFRWHEAEEVVQDYPCHFRTNGNHTQPYCSNCNTVYCWLCYFQFSSSRVFSSQHGGSVLFSCTCRLHNTLLRSYFDDCDNQSNPQSKWNHCFSLQSYTSMCFVYAL